MRIVIPKKIRICLPTIPNERNLVLIDGAVKEMGNDALLLSQILFKNKICPKEDNGTACFFEVSDPNVEQWILAVLAGGEPRVRAIGYWCDFLLIASREDPKKPAETKDLITAGFFATVASEPIPPFLHSFISKKAYFESRPQVLEDYIWLAEQNKAVDEFNFQIFTTFVGEMKQEYDRPFHLFYPSSTVRRALLDYATAVSASIYRAYGSKWRNFLIMEVFDNLLDNGTHPILKAIMAGIHGLP